MYDFDSNFILLNHGFKLRDIIFNGRYIHPQSGKPKNKIWAGLDYQNPETLMTAIETESLRLNDEGYNCYAVMNKIDPEFLNSDAKAVSDKHIVERNLILVDIDRKEDTKRPASNKELSESKSIASSIITQLLRAEFPDPYLVMSGNGHHIYISLDHWPNNDESKNLIKTFLKHLGEVFDTASHKIDTTVHNASRITKMIGTIARKGEKSHDRPYRRAKMIQESNGRVSMEKMKWFLSEKLAPKVNSALPTSSVMTTNSDNNQAICYSEIPHQSEIQKFTKALEHFSPDDDRGDGRITGDGKDWLGLVFAAASIGAYDEVKAWSMQAKVKEFNEEKFQRDYDSWGKTSNPTTVASVYYHLNNDGRKGLSDEIGLTDVANGKRFAKKFHQSLMSVLDTDIWINWTDSVGWKVAPSDVPIQAAKLVLEDMRNETAKALQQGKDVKRMLSEVSRTSKASNLQSMIKMAKTESNMSITFDKLDIDPYLLGVQNGVLDLRSKDFTQLNCDCYVVKRANTMFDPNATAPRFSRFLEEIIPDQALREFLLRLMGYFLTGSVREHKWFFFIGEGRNGKGVICRTLMKLLGDYAQKIETHILMQGAPKAQNAASPEILSLQGKRFLSGNETREGQAWDDARIKDMTGGDVQSGRFNHQNHYVQFEPTYKIVVSGNNYPMARDNSKGFWDRLVVFPFDVNLTPDEVNPDLEEKYLYKELPGILNLLLDGLEDYLENGLQIPKALQDATNKYRDESDLIKQFIQDKCAKGPELKELVQKTYLEYSNWAKENGLSPMAQPRFSRALVRQPGITKKSDQRNFWGIEITTASRTFLGR